MLGRLGRQSPLNTMKSLAADENRSPYWQIIGLMGLAAGFIILSYYSVIAGWTIAYIFRTGSGMFTGTTAQESADIFHALISDPEKLLAWHTIFMVMTIIVVSRGVRSGLEQAVRILMPALFLLLLIMAGYALSTDKFMQGLDYMFVPNFQRIADNFEQIFLNALGQSFFSLSIGMGAMMIYGSYLSDRSSIPATTFTVVLANTSVSLLAGIIIFPIIFSYGLDPTTGGPGLIFVSLPIAFGKMPGGIVIGTLFFFLLMFAAWTSAISLLEPAVTWLVENIGINRVKASAYSGMVAWALGIVTILSFNRWAFSFTFAGQDRINGMFDVFDILTSDFLLPLGGLLIAVFAVWRLSREAAAEEMNVGRIAFRVWYFFARYVAPIGVTLIFLQAVGIL
jgi:NSS family neurotransmitter:Na+ symporter